MSLEEALDKIEDLELTISEQKQEIEEFEKEVDNLGRDIVSLENDLENKRREPLDYQALQLKHPRLFTGDLSRLTHADRRELFEAIHDFDSVALARIEAFI